MEVRFNKSLLAVVVLGISATLLQAADPPAPTAAQSPEKLMASPQVVPAAPQQVYVYPQTTVTEMGGAEIYADPEPVGTVKKPAKCLHCQRIHDYIADHPCKCYADINTIGCSSLKAECTFIFGSCRQFFGETCKKGPE